MAEDPVEVTGPDGQTYHFPAGTDKNAAIKYFQSKGIKEGATEETSTGIRVPKGMVGERVAGPNTVLGGVARRAGETVKGALETLSPIPREGEGAGGPSLIGRRLAKGLIETEKEAGSQAAEQFRTARDMKGDAIAKGLKYAQAGVTAASTLDPFATGAVANINRKEAEGRSKEAIGAGAFDAITLLIGGRSGRKPTAEGAVNKLTYAAGGEKAAIEHVLPDIEETVKQTGKKPQVIGDLQNVVQDTLTRHENHFNTRLQGVAGQKVIPIEISDALRKKADSLPPTAATEAKALRRAAVTYEKPWTMRDLNAERMYRTDKLNAFYNKGQGAQGAAMGSQVDTMIDKIVEKEVKDVVYDYMDKRFPGENFKVLKQKQSSLLDLKHQLDDHVQKIENQQAMKEGAPVTAKHNVTATVSPHGVLPRLHNMMPGRGPLSSANLATRQAFGPTTGAAARRAAILALPITALGAATPAVPPPPQGVDESERPEQ